MMKSKHDICKQDTEKVLLVEGTNDCHVVMALCAALKVPKTFGIYACGSDDKVLRRLNALISRSEPMPPRTIGVILDVDKPSIEDRWDSIRGKLSRYQYIFPAAPEIDGTIIECDDEDKPKLGFWLMPDNQKSGMLEDFCAELAEPTSLAFARDCVEKAQSQHITTFKPSHHSKAVVHTYLAWQDEPGRPLGQAITARALKPNTDIAERFTRWLTHLFTETPDKSIDLSG